MTDRIRAQARTLYRLALASRVRAAPASPMRDWYDGRASAYWVAARATYGLDDTDAGEDALYRKCVRYLARAS